MLPQEYLLHRAMKYLAKRPRSEHEVTSYLSKVCDRFPKYYTIDMIEGVIEKLKKHKYVDDREFALWWVSNRTEFRQRSSYAISIELKRKQVDPDTIKDVLHESAIDDYTLAVDFLKKKIKTTELTQEEKKKLFAKAARKGFSYSIIQKAFEEITS